MSTEATVKRPAETSRGEPTRGTSYYRPNVDIIEQQGELLIVADLPGAAADQIDIQFEDGMLTIHGRVPPRQADAPRYLLQEYGVGDFYRTFQVGEQIDAGRISAQYALGVLTLHLPKVEAAKPRKINVQLK